MKIYRNNGPYIEYLVERDPKLSIIFQSPEKIEFHLSEDHFHYLLSAITFQQLSGRVAQTIFNRVEALFDQDITPQKVLNASFDELRVCGLSSQKISYYKSLAELVAQGIVQFTNVKDMSDESVIEMVTKIKGIGPWTADMFLMFALGRDDIFSVLDLGLRKAVCTVYGKDFTKDEILQISQKWIPYRSVVSHYLWHYLEDKK